MSSSIFDFGLPDARAVLSLDSRLKARLEQNLNFASQRISSFTDKMARGKLSSSRDQKLIDARMMLEAVADDLCRELIKLGKRANMHKKDDIIKFEQTRKTVLSLWKEYQEAAAVVMDRTSKVKSKRRH